LSGNVGHARNGDEVYGPGKVIASLSVVTSPSLHVGISICAIGIENVRGSWQRLRLHSLSLSLGLNVGLHLRLGLELGLGLTLGLRLRKGMLLMLRLRLDLRLRLGSKLLLYKGHSGSGV
jgi:hypothetical protein